MKKAVYFLMLTILIASCKKKDTESPTPEEDPVPVDSTSYGVFRIVDSTWIKNDSILIPGGSNATVNFNDANGSNTTINSVSVNGISVPYQFGRYYLTVPGKSIIPSTWNIKGSVIIPDFNYAHMINYPAYSNYKILPSVIDRSKDLSFTLSGFENTTYVLIYINDQLFHGAMMGASPGNSKTITFPSSMLLLLSPNKEATIEVRADNYAKPVLGGKMFTFIHEVLMIKKTEIK